MDNRSADVLLREVTGTPWTQEDQETWALAARQGARQPLAMLLERIVNAPSDAAAARVMRRDGWGEIRGHNSRWMRTLRGQAHRIRRIWQRQQALLERRPR